MGIVGDDFGGDDEGEEKGDFRDSDDEVLDEKKVKFIIFYNYNIVIFATNKSSIELHL